MGIAKYIETPEQLYELFENYRKETKANPFLVTDWVGGKGIQVTREKERPLTKEGFYNYVARVHKLMTLKDYFSNRDERYNEYVPICSHICDEIRQDQIEGGMAGMYNPSITQRLNGLTEKTETEATTKLVIMENEKAKSEIPLANSEKDIVS